MTSSQICNRRLGAPPPSSGISSDAWFGIERLLFDYAEIEPDDDIIVVYTPDVRVPASWVCLALQVLQIKYSIVPMAPLSDCGFEQRLRDRVPTLSRTSGKCVVLVFEWETMSHNQVFRQVFAGYPSSERRIIRCMNTDHNLFAVGLQPHPQELSRRNADLLDFLYRAEDIRVRTPSGTDLEITLNSKKFEWISNRGAAEAGRMIVLPPGEIATFPAKINGTLVADFAINVNYTFDGDVGLANTPVKVKIENNMLVDFYCESKRISAQLDQFFRMQGACHVGELGFGTHPSVTKAVAENSHLNERKVGVHIGFGQHNQSDDVAGYVAQVHVDLIAAGGSALLADGKEIFFDDVPFTGALHPALLQSEDVFSPEVVPPDCCGIRQ